MFLREGKPVKRAVVKVYFSPSGKSEWVWTTDEDGKFTTGRLAPGSYRLEVGGSAGATVRLNPALSHLRNGQVVNWNLTLTEDGCISAGASTNSSDSCCKVAIVPTTHAQSPFPYGNLCYGLIATVTQTQHTCA